MQNRNPKFKNLIFISIIFIFAFFSFYLVFENARASGTANFQIEIFYAKESHQIDTTQTFSESLVNPNNTQLDVSFPADSLTSGEAVEMTFYSTAESAVVSSAPLPSGKLAADTFYNFSFEKVSDSSLVSSFDRAITLTFYYTDSDISGIDESTLTAYRWNGSEWVALSDSTVDTSLNKVTASSQQFSYFALLGDAPPSCGDGSCNGSETCSTCPADCGACPSSGGGGGGGGSYTSPAVQTVVKFSGRAYPKTTVTLLKDAQIATTTIAGSDANFQMSLSDLSAGNYIFSVYSEDKEGRRSTLLTFPVSITQGAITDVSGIFIAPTIDVDKSEVKRGDNIAILGQSAPLADIIISVNSEEEFFGKTISDKDGIYLHNFDTTILDYGTHYTKSKASIGNLLISGYGRVITFKVGTTTVLKEKKPEISKGDLNNDNRINLVDFSIAAYWYKRTSPPSSVDLNEDGKVDLVDFSIMAYYWTG